MQPAQSPRRKHRSKYGNHVLTAAPSVNQSVAGVARIGLPNSSTQADAERAERSQDGKAGITYGSMFLLNDDSVCQDSRARVQDLQLATLSYATSPPLRGFGPLVVGGVSAERDAFELERDIGMIKRTPVVAGFSAALVLTGAAAFAQTSRAESSLNRMRYLPEYEDPSGTFARLRLERVENPARTSAGAKQGSGATVLDFAGRAARARGGALRSLRSGQRPRPLHAAAARSLAWLQEVPVMKRSDPKFCPRCRGRVPRAAARCPWCLGYGIKSDKSAPAGAPTSVSASGRQWRCWRTAAAHGCR
jgi:hypothetical protein